MGGFECGGDLRADHLADIAAKLADLAHQRAADALQRRVGQHEYGFNFGPQLAVHRGHLRFAVEVGEIAAAHDRCGFLRGAEVDDEAVERPNSATRKRQAKQHCLRVRWNDEFGQHVLVKRCGLGKTSSHRALFYCTGTVSGCPFSPTKTTKSLTGAVVLFFASCTTFGALWAESPAFSIAGGLPSISNVYEPSRT